MLDNKKTESLTQSSQHSRFPCHDVYLPIRIKKIAYECYDVGQKKRISSPPIMFTNENEYDGRRHCCCQPVGLYSVTAMSFHFRYIENFNVLDENQKSIEY